LKSLIAETEVVEAKAEKDWYEEFYFLKHLYTGEREASYTSGCGWFFSDFLQEYDERVRDIVHLLYPTVSDPLYTDNLEEKYYESIYAEIEETECEKRDELNEQFNDLFRQYLAKQDWHRFIQPVLDEVCGR